MSSSQEEYLVALEHVFEAVRNYAKPEINMLIQKAIYRLRRIPASGIYGDAYIFKTQWDEYCHEIQEGPFDLPIWGHSPATAWEETISALIDDLIDHHIPNHAKMLLSITAAWELDEDASPPSLFWPDTVGRFLKSGLDEEAGARNLFRFGPWRNG